MINRVLIRIKAVQLIYSFLISQNKTVDKAEKEFFFSLEKSYELYFYLLQLIVDLTDYMQDRLTRRGILSKKIMTNRFVENQLAAELSQNVQISKFVADKKISWKDYPETLRDLANMVLKSEEYVEYINSSEEPSLDSDKEFWKKIMKKVILPSEVLQNQLEELCIYWNDDLEIISGFFLKTIKRYDPEHPEAAIIPMFKDKEDEDYARTLFVKTVENGLEYEKLVESHIKNWDLERVAQMDMAIMQMAISELLNFPNIPVTVTLNEYIEIAKAYSTEKSSVFINGTLDAIVNTLQKENKLLKVVRL